MTIRNKKERTLEIIKRLKKTYPDAHCALNHTNPFELTIATLLSAQCTDRQVNIVTANLFRKYKTPQDYFDISVEELEHDIRSIGFFRAKAKNIQALARTLLDNFNGEIPKTLDEMVTLAGVGRKTANVVLGNAFGIPSGVVVDTHVSRLSQRLGLTKNKTPEKIEKDLEKLVPRENWIMFPHWLIFHGRQICDARKPKCLECPLADICPSFKLFVKK